MIFEIFAPCWSLYHHIDLNTVPIQNCVENDLEKNNETFYLHDSNDILNAVKFIY